MNTENTQKLELGYILDVGTLRELLAFIPDDLRVGTSEDGRIVFYDDECEHDVEDEENYDGETWVIRTFIPLNEFKDREIELDTFESNGCFPKGPYAHDFFECENSI